MTQRLDHRWLIELSNKSSRHEWIKSAEKASSSCWGSQNLGHDMNRALKGRSVGAEKGKVFLARDWPSWGFFGATPGIMGMLLFCLQSQFIRWHFSNKLSLAHCASEARPDRPFNLPLEKVLPILRWKYQNQMEIFVHPTTYAYNPHSEIWGTRISVEEGSRSSLCHRKVLPQVILI